MQSGLQILPGSGRLQALRKRIELHTGEEHTRPTQLLATYHLELAHFERDLLRFAPGCVLKLPNETKAKRPDRFEQAGLDHQTHE